MSLLFFHASSMAEVRMKMGSSVDSLDKLHQLYPCKMSNRSHIDWILLLRIFMAIFQRHFNKMMGQVKVISPFQSCFFGIG